MTGPVGTIETDGTPIEALDGHDCSWQKYIEGQRTRTFGGNALLRAGDKSLLETLHADGTCPPTHINRGPTLEWSDLVHTNFR